MRYKITHVTRYSYAEAVSVCHNEACLTPRNTRSQICEYHRLRITPQPSSAGRRTDYFGNVLNFFSFNEGFRELTVKAVSRIQVRGAAPDPKAPSPAWEEVVASVRQDLRPEAVEAYQFAFNSPRVAVSDPLREYAADSFPPKRPVVAALADLTRRVHKDFAFDAKATHVNTTVEEVLELRRGVCQDFTHLQIGLARSLGLPARYVSGYLRTYPPPGKPRLTGADMSHAWVSVWCGELGWVDVDPTNDVFPATDHVTVAWGRDYGDIAPLKGVFVGGGPHTLSVSVDVLPLEAGKLR
jgi:transglutaminase-like putative cysteine protease